MFFIFFAGYIDASLHKKFHHPFPSSAPVETRQCDMLLNALTRLKKQQHITYFHETCQCFFIFLQDTLTRLYIKKF